MEATAAVSRSVDQPFTIETLSVGALQPDEVLVRIAGVGLCHTDLVFSDGTRPYPLPAVFGHEGAGVIDRVGASVDGFVPGDAVIIGFSSCGHCRQCEHALPSYCEKFLPLNFAGAREDGTSALSVGDERVGSHFFGQSSFASYAVVRTRNLVKVVDSGLPLELLGPLGCGLQTGAGAVLNAMDCAPGSRLFVAGGGPVGLAAVMAGAIAGCASIILSEPVEARRELARELGATLTIDPRQDVTSQLRDAGIDGIDFALDTTGRLDVIKTLVANLALHGTLGIVGVSAGAADSLPVNLAEWMGRGLRLVGIIEGDSDQENFIPQLLEYQKAGRFPFEKMIQTFPLASINEAIQAQGRGDCIKAVLVP